jgi:hypothetical protein
VLVVADDAGDGKEDDGDACELDERFAGYHGLDSFVR